MKLKQFTEVITVVKMIIFEDILFQQQALDMKFSSYHLRYKLIYLLFARYMVKRMCGYQQNKTIIKQYFYQYNMYQIFRTIKMMRHIIRPIRFSAPIVATNNYLNLYNLNQFYLSLLIETNEEDEEFMQVKLEPNIHRSIKKEKCVVQN
ncbi:unnamed protein product (macronuclear) [Paramecium tetraurelia]|uniref:Transmembrane protein n=1 Tax=Paramecium tetraurelia TaxID=5888 RepID=A0C763_PARTE|nr:uncharacterized protein GSPATT00035760001 [Paramecium tetraurelia]CAK66630.1 unnamed protein product [Paramecium tetraurelia]|eukprot:XP_001434027.1 hypothetical protein (macronuclear) [Paramecium tetraurelia strain d4-2]